LTRVPINTFVSGKFILHWCWIHYACAKNPTHLRTLGGSSVARRAAFFAHAYKMELQ